MPRLIIVCFIHRQKKRMARCSLTRGPRPALPNRVRTPFFRSSEIPRVEVPPRSRTSNARLLLLRALDLVDLLHDLAKHDDAVAVKEGDARQTLAVLEGVDDQGLLRGEVHLSHLVRLEGVRVLHLLAARLLADLPHDLGHAARGPTAAHEADRRVADLDLAPH